MSDSVNNLESAKKQVITCLHNNRLHDAAGLIGNICKRYSDNAEAWEIFAAVYTRLGEFDLVLAACRQLIRLHPHSAQAHFNLALALDLTGYIAESIDVYQKALQIEPVNADARYNLGLAMQNMGNLGVAASHYREALKIRPNWPEASNNLAIALREIGNMEAAISTLRVAVASNPTRIKLRHTLGGFYEENGQYELALLVYREALGIEPGNAQTLAHIGHALNNQGLIDKAIDCYQKAIDLDGDDPDIILGLIEVYSSTGDYENACKQMLPLVKAHPENPKVALKFASLCNYTGKCKEAVELLQGFLKQNTLQTDIDRKIHFTIGKILDSSGNYDHAFMHIIKANELKHYLFDIERFSKLTDRVIDAFSREAFPSLARSPDYTDRPKPVFIVGMPRSGTSLVEQIIATHRHVYGAGEQDYIPRLVASLANADDGKNPYPYCIRDISKQSLCKYSNEYLECIGRFDISNFRIISDKMPENFLHLGFIELLFPGSRIIHCVRDPLDTCLSCYFQEFSGSHHYAYDLTNLGAYYAMYRKLMAHWMQVLSLPVHEVRYEDMVSETETTCRNLFDFLDLDWDKGCLQFYKSGRFVNTASQQQVTQPIYTKSVGRWKHYRKHLGTLIAALNTNV